ncbi:helix-turn-helix domain-containing protein [Microbispora triticiradicis]|uniref:helix-turn-helix domain-containing protein n=1 Tax=Microbispora triticiradicis TaxID=2200763 RepID=UPI003A598BFC
MAQIVRRAYRYRFYPTPEQASELARTFGCVRVGYKKARPIPDLTDQDGRVTNPGHERAGRRRMGKAQRSLARKAAGSANRARARLKVARARIADRRRDVNAAKNVLAAGPAER